MLTLTAIGNNGPPPDTVTPLDGQAKGPGTDSGAIYRWVWRGG